MNEDQFDPQDQSVIDEGIASMDAQQTQEMMLSVNNKPSVTLTEEGRIVWGRGGMNNPHVVYMLDQAAADPRTLTTERAAKCYRDIAIGVVYDKANEGLSDAELAKLIADECGVNNLAYTLFPNSENSEADHKALMDAAIMPIINGRTVKMKGIAETAYTNYRANAELAQQITEREHQTRRELEKAKMAVNEKGEPIDEDGDVVDDPEDQAVLTDYLHSDQYLDTKAYLDYKADSVKTELLSVMSEAAAAYKLEHPEATDAELYDAARRAGAASYADIVNTVDNDPDHYATFQARRDARRAKDNVLYFKRMQDAKADLERAGELAQEVNAAVDAENNATKAENRFLVNAANENTKREMEAKYPNAVPDKETKRKPFKAGAPFTTQIKRSKTAGNEYTNPTLVVPQDVFDNLVADLGVKQGQYVVVQMGTASKKFTADIRVGNVNGYRMNKALFNELAKREGTKTQAPTHEQLSAIAAGARQSTIYFYVVDKPARK